MEELIKQIDWSLLKEQKQTLVNLQVENEPPTDHQKEHINGIINLLTKIQEIAVDQYDLPKDKVF